MYISKFLQALGVFGLCQMHTFVDYVRSKLTGEQFNLLFKSIILLFGSVGTLAVAIATALGSILSEKKNDVKCLNCCLPHLVNCKALPV